MRRMGWVLSLAVIGLVAAGCGSDKNYFYKRPDIEGWYAEVNPGWTEAQIFVLLGKPTRIVEHELFYIYDDPDQPVRLRFVLDDKGEVVEKYYETWEELAKKAEEMTNQPPPPKKGETPETYPARRWSGSRPRQDNLCSDFGRPTESYLAPGTAPGADSLAGDTAGTGAGVTGTSDSVERLRPSRVVNFARTSTVSVAGALPCGQGRRRT